MPPKSSVKSKEITEKDSADNMDEIRRSLSFMSAEIAKLASQHSHLVGLIEEVGLLRKMVEERDKKIVELEKKFNDLEQYTRRDDVLISGLKTQHRSYAQATANEVTTDDAPLEQLLSLEQQVVNFLQSKNFDVQTEDISICHTLPVKSVKFKSPIVIRFISRKMRNNVLMQAKKLKGTGVYINEHLTKKNGDIAREARLLRKQKGILATWTRNGNVWIKVEEKSPAKMIREIHELDEFKRQ